MRRFYTVNVGFFGLALGAAPLTVEAGYNRLSLDEKVRLSQAIIVGTAVSQSEHAPFSTAARKAVFKVDQVLKGSLPEGEITIGYRSGDEIYDVNNKETVRLPADPIVVGKPCILFLRPAVSGVFAPVNWQHGIIPIENGNVTDPRWPGDDVGLLYRHNILEAKTAPKHHPWDFRGVIRSDEALEHIRAAVKLVENQKDIGRMSINGAPTTVLWESGENHDRLLVRVPKRVECPPFDATRFSAMLIPPSGEPIRPQGPAVLETAPVSVDPLSTTEQLALPFNHRKEGAIKGVELVIDGQKRTFCVDAAAGCKSDSIAVRCPACKSADTRLYHISPRAYTDRPCAFLPDPLPVTNTDSKEFNLSYHCNACEFEW